MDGAHQLDDPNWMGTCKVWVEAQRPEAPRAQMVRTVSLTARASSPLGAAETVAVVGGGGGNWVQLLPGPVTW